MRAQHMKGRNMNRHQRRAAQAKARNAGKSGTSRIVAVHEAGHAVAKVLAAGDLGYGFGQIISRIEMKPSDSWEKSVDGKALTRTQAVTFGPKFSVDILIASNDFIGTYLSEHGEVGGRQVHEFNSKIIELGRAAGADIGKWLFARTFDGVSGSMAEAIVSNRPFYEVWNGRESEGDLWSIIEDCKISGTENRKITTLIEETAALSALVMDDPKVWAAVLALAKTLARVDQMDGSKVISIITRVLPEVDLTSKFATAVERLHEVKEQIAVNEVVIARFPDGSHGCIKGEEVIEKSRAGGCKPSELEALCYVSNHLVCAETLNMAFGDGLLARAARTNGVVE